MIIDIPPHIEQMIIAKAQSQNLSVADLITQWATDDDVLLTDFFASLPKIDVFDEIDPVAYQRALRDEWR
ncbi:MAG: hypothetical protein Q4A69_09625 [Moraxella sp.]|nr:hypothetical protein [Moraxella sp.]